MHNVVKGDNIYVLTKLAVVESWNI